MHAQFYSQWESRVRNSRIGLAMAHGAALLASRVGSEFNVTCSSDAPETTLLRSVRRCCEAWAVTGRGRSQITHSLPWWMLDLLTVRPLYPPQPKLKPAEGLRWTRTQPTAPWSGLRVMSELWSQSQVDTVQADCRWPASSEPLIPPQQESACAAVRWDPGRFSSPEAGTWRDKALHGTITGRGCCCTTCYRWRQWSRSAPLLCDRSNSDCGSDCGSSDA